MQRYTIYLYLETALHVSGGTSTHHQERMRLYLQHLVFVTPLLLPAARGGRTDGQTDMTKLSHFNFHGSVHRKKIPIYRVEQEECARLREGVPYVKVYRYNPKHLYPKLNGLGDNGN